VMPRRKTRASDLRCDNNRCIGPEPVGLSKRPFNHSPKILPTVASIILLAAFDAEKSAGGHILNLVGRQQDGNGVILTIGGIIHRASDSADRRFILSPRTAGQ